MSKIVAVEELSTPAPPPVGRVQIYPKAGTMYYMGSDGVEHILEDPDIAVNSHEGAVNPHPQYLTQEEADLAYAFINHVHATANLITVCKSGTPGSFTTLAAALAAIGTGSYAAASTTNRYVIKVNPGEFSEPPGTTIPAYVYVSGNDPWNSAVLKTTDLTNDFIIVAPNGGLFNIAVSGPTTAGKSAIKQIASGTTKLYWVNIKEGSYGVTLAPASGTARCHAIGVVTDGPTQMNRMFNCDNPAGVGVFILMQSGPMSTTWVGTQPSAVYLNGNGTLNKVNATLDLCQFRGTGYDAVYGDNAALVRGICCSFAGGINALHIGPNGASKFDMHGSQIKPGGWTKDIWCESATASVSFSGVATESKLTIASGATFVGSFADTDPAIGGQVIYGELWIGNTQVKTPLASYIQADKNTGLVSGGGLSRGAGTREIDVTAGVAFIDTANGLKKVTWGNTTLTIPANSPEARIYINNAGTVGYSLTPVDKELNVVIGEVGSNATEISYVFDATVLLPQFRPRLYEYMEKVLGPINISGGFVTPSGLGFAVSASTYYLTEVERNTNDIASATFYQWYRDGAGGWTVTSGVTSINANQYDDGTGTLATMTDGKYRRDNIFVCNHGTMETDVHVIIGQAQFDSEILANSNPLIPDPISEHACRVAAAVVLKNAATFTAVDQRPKLGQMAAGSTGITSHDDLTARNNPAAHSQYQLVSEKGNPNGYPSLDAGGLIPTGQIPTIAHGNQAGGSLHANATTSVAGFMSGGDKTKLDGIAANATVNATDAALRDRATHTGAQAISTVTGLQNALDSKITGSRQVAVLGSVVQGSSNALSDVTGVSVPVVAGTYVIKANIVYQSTATGTGIAFSLNGPATSSLAMRKIIPTSATAAGIYTSNSFATTQASGTTTTANADQYADLEAVITFTTSGTLILRYASESGGTNVSVRPGTTMFVEKVA